MDRRQFLRLMAGSVAYPALPALASTHGFTPVLHAISTIPRPIVKVIGIGGAGVNIIEHLMRSEIHGVSEYVCVDSNLKTLQFSPCTTQIPLQSLKPGLVMPDGESQIPRLEPYESEQLSRAIDGTDLVFVVTGLGGRTGSLASEVVVRTAKKAGVLTVALVVMPSRFESSRPRHAKTAMERIQPHVHLIVPFHLDQIRSLFFSNKQCFPEILEYCDSKVAATLQVMAAMLSTPAFIGEWHPIVKTFLKTTALCSLGWGTASDSQPLWIAGAQAELSCLGFDMADRVLFAISTHRDHFGSTEFRKYVIDRQVNVTDKKRAFVYDFPDDNLAHGVTREIIVASSSLPESGEIPRFLQNLPD